MLSLGGLIVDAVCEGFPVVGMRSWGPVLENGLSIGHVYSLFHWENLFTLLKLCEMRSIG